MFRFIRKQKVLKLINNRILDLEVHEKRWKEAGDMWREASCRGAINELRLLKYDIIAKWGDSNDYV